MSALNKMAVMEASLSRFIFSFVCACKSARQPNVVLIQCGVDTVCVPIELSSTQCRVNPVCVPIELSSAQCDVGP